MRICVESETPSRFWESNHGTSVTWQAKLYGQYVRFCSLGKTESQLHENERSIQ